MAGWGGNTTNIIVVSSVWLQISVQEHWRFSYGLTIWLIPPSLLENKWFPISTEAPTEIENNLIFSKKNTDYRWETFSREMTFISAWKKFNGNFGHESICTFAFFRENAELLALNCLVTLQRRNLVAGTNGKYKKCGRPNTQKSIRDTMFKNRSLLTYKMLNCEVLNSTR